MSITKYDINYCIELGKTFGFECLSDEYKNIDDNGLLWKCSLGHIWNTSLWVMKKCHSCPHCSSRAKHTINDCINFAISKGGKCLSTEYISSKEKLNWECKNSHQWSASFSSVCNKGTWCPKCAGKLNITINDCIELANGRGGRCLSDTYTNCKTKMQWECYKGHTWWAMFINIKNKNSWCPYCSNKNKNTLSEAIEIAKNNNGKCLSLKYISAHEKLEWECHNGHIWPATFNSIRRGSWCPECVSNKNQKKLVEIIKDIFFSYNILSNFTGFEWLRGKSKRKMEIDIWIPELKLAIEYDGKQHFESVCFGGISIDKAEENLKKQKERDKLKNKLIKKYPEEVRYFFRFNYKDKITKEFIMSRLKKVGIDLKE